MATAAARMQHNNDGMTPSSSLLYYQYDELALQQRLSLVSTRPSTLMANEFFHCASSGEQQPHQHASSQQQTPQQLHWRTLPKRIDTLVKRLRQWQCTLDSPELTCAWMNNESVEEARRVAMTAAILATATTTTTADVDTLLYAPFTALFAASLQRRDRMTNQDDDDDNDNIGLSRGGRDNDDDDEFWTNETEEQTLLFENLRYTGWIRDSSRALLYQPLMNAITSVIYRKVQDMIAGDFESDAMKYDHTLAWMHRTVAPWLRDLMTTTVTTCTTTTNSNGEAMLVDNVGDDDDRLVLCTAECYCQVRLNEIFEMVTSFPDSMPAVLELRHVLELTGMQRELQQALRDSLMRRLTHPGADTSQMIDVYISTIKVLRLMDTTSGDHLLTVTTDPVRAYLRNRSDTVRCIITSLTDADAGGDLYQELRRQDAKPLENVTTDSDDEEECPTMQWQPKPSLLMYQQRRGENSLFGSSSSTTTGDSGGGSNDCDILAMLVSIYGSKELFVNEYRLMLADKLLANLDYNTDKEVHTLELLKLRFGEASMVSAEVMIKDIEDSVRANKNIRDSLRNIPKQRSTDSATTTPREPAVDAAMISHIFWPKLQNDPLKHHPRIQAELDDFGDVYAEQKNPRKLNWIYQLGLVQLELDVVEDAADGESRVETKEYTCSPLHATLISHFEDKPTWTAEELSNETGVPERIIQKRMAYWVTNRIVTFSVDAYTLSSHADRQSSLRNSDSHTQQAGLIMDDDDDGTGGSGDGAAVVVASASAQAEEAMAVYESYITVMLTNMPYASLERIHSMLHLMSSSGGGGSGGGFGGADGSVVYNQTPQQLSAFLQRLCRQEKLEYGPDGMYKLFKK